MFKSLVDIRQRALSHRVGRWHSVVWFLIEGTAIFWPAALLVACLILEFLNP